MTIKPNFNLEDKYISLGYTTVAGVDEVGRGCLAGPLLACAVVFDNINLEVLREIKDSKKLTAKQRAEQNKTIRELACDFNIGQVGVDEIDRMGVGAANILAFHRALNGLKEIDFALIDGRHFRGFDYKYKCIVRGESESISIAAASIVAKVERDKLMAELDVAKLYGFDRHAGYGTPEHIALIRKHGPSIHHRKTFLGKIWQEPML